ncbi:hypothetical protein IFM89_029342 [Coptis chinensis]|uniref:Tafazzin family protein n=1 Tax=Coptis chinensis TaxID=261450 RepID=A0A835M706_9MAGN|nr:hypothetical protein IFM89_029342 [Coptis chinensis]
MESVWGDGKDIWKNKIQALQLRFRDRFRVTVDKHNRVFRQRISDGYFSTTVQRWLLRFRTFQNKSLPSASKFYCKRVSKDVDGAEDSVLSRMLQAIAVPVLGNVCHVFMHGLNHVQIYGAEKLQEALLHRQEGKPLLTVSNHVASVDDPFVIASLLPPSVMLDAHNLRWTLCATDRCFKNPATSAFFQSVKVLPVSRGDGIYQKGMDMALSKLNNGAWVHIFPEGSRSRDGGRTMGSIKRGVGRLVMDADNVPLVVPFVHTGMQDIMPIGSKFPKIGKTVTVLIGDPIHLDDLVSADDRFISRGELYDAISLRIGHRLQELKVQVDKLALQHSLEVQTHTSQNGERATGILQQVDWEAFGMSSYILADKDSSSLTGVTEEPQKLNIHHEVQPTYDRYFRVSFFHEGGLMSRVHGYMYPTELMGFAARGLFMNTRNQIDDQNNVKEVGPLKAWKQYFEASIFCQWNCK